MKWTWYIEYAAAQRENTTIIFERWLKQLPDQVATLTFYFFRSVCTFYANVNFTFNLMIFNLNDDSWN